jgi:hypothetical protein
MISAKRMTLLLTGLLLGACAIALLPQFLETQYIYENVIVNNVRCVQLLPKSLRIFIPPSLNLSPPLTRVNIGELIDSFPVWDDLPLLERTYIDIDEMLNPVTTEPFSCDVNFCNLANSFQCGTFAVDCQKAETIGPIQIRKQSKQTAFMNSRYEYLLTVTVPFLFLVLTAIFSLVVFTLGFVE